LHQGLTREGGPFFFAPLQPPEREWQLHIASVDGVAPQPIGGIKLQSIEGYSSLLLHR